jgi:hypothetical protein
MVAWEQLVLPDKRAFESVYLGLSATKEGTKTSGKVRELYDRLNSDAVNHEDQTGNPLLMWFTTASPSVHFAAGVVWAQVEPRADGTFSQGSGSLASAMRMLSDPLEFA